MALCDNIEYRYLCPHCKGRLVITVTIYQDGGEVHMIEHETPEGQRTVLEEVEVKNA